MTTEFSAVGIAVSDLPASLAFYRALGLEFEGSEEAGHLEASLPGGTRLMLDTEEVMTSFDHSYEAPSGAGRISLAFGCTTPEAVDTLHASMVKAGYDSLRSPFDAFWGQRYATILDPDGNAVDLFSPQPDQAT